MRKLQVSTAAFRSTLPDDVALQAVTPLDEAMSAHVSATLRLTHGRIEGPHGAATRLAINPHTLRARMRKLRLSPARFRSDAVE